MYDGSGARRLSQATLVGLAALATASSALVPLTRQGLLPSFAELAVPVAMTAAAAIAFRSFRAVACASLAVGAICWSLTGLAPHLPAWGEALVPRLALLPLALVVVCVLAGTHHQLRGLARPLAGAALVVAVLAGAGMKFPALSGLGALLVVAAATIRPRRRFAVAQAALGLGLVVLDPRLDWSPTSGALGGDGVSVLMVVATVAVTFPHRMTGWDRVAGVGTAAEFGHRIGSALGTRHAEVWFPVDDGYVNLAGHLGSPGPNAINVQDAVGRPVALLVGPTDIDRSLRRPLAELLLAAGRLARLRHESRCRADDLVASQRRLVTAADQERARIQSQLARTVLTTLDDLDNSLHTMADPGSLPSRLTATRAELTRFGSGLDPLADRTLPDAVRALAVGPQVTVRAADQDVAATADGTAARTVWYVAAEAVSNALKHAAGAPVLIELNEGSDLITVRVSDLGPGGVPPHGLVRLHDRVRAVGGELRVSSGSSGTTVVATVPSTATGLPLAQSRVVHDPPDPVPYLGSKT